LRRGLHGLIKGNPPHPKLIFLVIQGLRQVARRHARQTVAVVQLPEHQTTGIRGYLAALKIGNNFLGEKAFKAKLIMTDCFRWTSLLRSCLFGDNSILAHVLPSFKNFSQVIQVKRV
jgi:hypothetical protein